MANLKALREQAGKLSAELTQLVDTDKAVNADGTYTEAWVKANGDMTVLRANIKAAETAEVVAAEMRESAALPGVGKGDFGKAGNDGAQEVTEEHRALALASFVGHGVPWVNLTDKHREACKLLNFDPSVSGIQFGMLNTGAYRSLQSVFRSSHVTAREGKLAEFRATLTTGSGPGGGYLVPPETLLRNMEINMLTYGGMRQVADSLRTAQGERMSWPTADDTTNTGVQIGEVESIGSSVDPTFGKIYWDAYDFSSKVIRVPTRLLEDSWINLPQELGLMLGERLGRITNTKYTTGTGASTPKGIITAATSYSAASASAIAADDIVKLMHSVDPAYRSGAGFMCHDTILMQLRLLKDGNARPLFMDYSSLGIQDRLGGQSLTINQDMDSTISSGKKTLLYGQLSKYKIRTVGSTVVMRLNERYADTREVAFISFIREDGALLTAGTAPVKYLSH